MSIGCTDCKQKFPHYVLEFDHIPEKEKLRRVYKVFKTCGISAALQKIEKCEVVCANCHKTRTYKRKPWYFITLVLDTSESPSL